VGAPVKDGSVQIAAGRFPDYDAFAEAIAGWCIEFRQVDAGDSPTELMQIAAPGVLLSRARFERAYDQQGESPVGMRTVALLEQGVEDVTWCGRPFGETGLAVFPDADGFEASSRPGFGVWTLSIADDLLARRGEEVGRPDLVEGLMRTGVRSADPLKLARLRTALTTVARRLSCREAVDALIRGLPERVLEILASADAAPAAPSQRLRDRAFERARAYALDRAVDGATVTGMREASGASWRTLDYAFRERLGVTPQGFLKAIRLDALRKALLAADSSARIVDVATEHGFWHMGQLAADYRAQFGELPSSTLTRRRSVSAV